ncbi:MAG TPA: DnaJ family domain-containing protein, partial [Anaerolineae bacterium]|nr:DnaJ family domain-containing protein [Anaerolineae bacterium]
PAKWKDAAEEAIEEAIRSGAFDDLPGRGKPLNLINNPYAPGTELAYQLLQDNQYTLPWIAQRASLLASVDALRQEIDRTWTECLAEYHAIGEDSAAEQTARMELTEYWREQLAIWEQQIAELNKEIADLNLKQPGNQLEIMKLSLDIELARAGARRIL